MIIGSPQWIEQQFAAKDAEIARLRAILAPLVAHADRHDYAPPYMLNVQQCREIRDAVNVNP